MNQSKYGFSDILANPINIFIIFVLIRFYFVVDPFLLPQDAYYFLYTDSLSLSYFDHPPMISWILFLFRLIFGRNLFAIKIADFCVSIATIFVFYQLARTYKKDINKSLLIAISSILLTVITLITTPDIPLVLFWCLSVLFLYKAIFEEKVQYWIYGGIAMGLAFDSKYTAIFLQAGLILFLLFSKKYRYLLAKPYPWIALIIAHIFILPVYIWNANHHWVSFLYQSADRANALSNFNPILFLGFFLSQSIMLLPPLYFVSVWQMIKSVRNIFKIPDEQMFLFAFIFPMFFVFTIISFFYWIKINWLLPVYLLMIILFLDKFSYKLVKYNVDLSLALHIIIFFELIFYPIQIKSDDTFFGWQNLAQEVQKIKAENPQDFIFSNDNYKTTAVLRFLMNNKIYAGNIIGQKGYNFAYVDTNLNSLKGKDAIFLDSDPNFKNLNPKGEIPTILNNYFGRIVEMQPIIINDDWGRPARKFYVYKCYDYLGN
ncbi:MAG TPA: glycosyltransferase family 39 protein [Bacteroidota bacterium]|nr:glycosyltransferase family 39 protein [Bacteroidota bacterium]